MSFPRVKIPGGGSLQFEIPSDDPENPDYTKYIEGVILYNHDTCASVSYTHLDVYKRQLFDLLSGLYVVPISESPILRLISFIRLTVFEHIPYAVTKQIFRRDKRNSDEQKVMLLANQAMLSTTEMIKCAELNTFAFDSEDELIDTLYHDEYTRCV